MSLKFPEFKPRRKALAVRGNVHFALGGKFRGQVNHEAKLRETVKIAKLHISADEIAAILADELEQMQKRPVAEVLPWKRLG